MVQGEKEWLGCRGTSPLHHWGRSGAWLGVMRSAGRYATFLESDPVHMSACYAGAWQGTAALLLTHHKQQSVLDVS